MLKAIAKVVALSFAMDGVLALKEMKRRKAHEAKLNNRNYVASVFEDLRMAIAYAPKVDMWLFENPDKKVEDAIRHFTAPYTNKPSDILLRSWMFEKIFEIKWPIEHEMIERSYDEDPRFK